MADLCSGFGVKEYPLPPGTNISQVHTIHRHGSRYPEKDSAVEKFGQALADTIKKGARFSGALSFLNSWKYGLGWGFCFLNDELTADKVV